MAAADTLPSRLQHLDSERLASISYARLSHSDRVTLERLLSAAVTDEEAPPPAASAGAVHYFQAYCVDFLGAPSAAAAAAMPQPQYERLFDEPLPRAPCAPPRQPRRPNGFQGRYFDAPEAAHAPGVLSAELRALLGIGPADPPPYLRRMRELGYPPGYMGVPPSSAADGGEAEEEELCWHAHDTEPAPRAGGVAPNEQRLVPLVAFPGLNTPPPDGAEPRAWDWRGPVTRVADGSALDSRAEPSRR